MAREEATGREARAALRAAERTNAVGAATAGALNEQGESIGRAHIETALVHEAAHRK